jgi:transcriptional antiterminator RfaH
LLPLEPFVYPAGLFTTSEFPADLPWWVLHVRPRAEKALARDLLRLRHAFFLPLYKNQRQCGGHHLVSHLPLLPGYVFLRGEEPARLAALQMQRVVRTLAVPDGPRMTTDLARVHRLMENGLPMAPEERLQPGMPVTLTAGPLAGLDGVIVRRGKRLRFLIAVDFIQRGVTVEIEGWMLQPRSAELAAGA